MSPEPTREDLLAACRVLVAEDLGDFVYSVRESVLSDTSWKGNNTWDHPRVIAFGEASQVVSRFVKANPLPPAPPPPPDPRMGGDDIV